MLPDAEILDMVHPQLPTHSEEILTIVRLHCIGQCRSEAAVGSYFGPGHYGRSSLCCAVRHRSLPVSLDCVYGGIHRQLGPPICHQLKVVSLLTVSPSLQHFHVVTTSNKHPFPLCIQMDRLRQGAVWGKCSGRQKELSLSQGSDHVAACCVILFWVDMDN